MKRTWLITGASSGLGKALAEAVIGHGDFVFGTFRDKLQASQFTDKNTNGIGIVLDITKPDEIKKAYSIIKKHGRLDVLVNNAGVGFVGAVEETGSSEVREILETNFYAPLNITQMFLPIFRKQRGGQIIQVSSHGGLKAFAGFGIYNASKFALEGFSEALAQEIAPLGIKLTIVEPGPFRTNFAGSALRLAAKTIEDYNGTAGVFKQKIKAIHGRQEGDPVKAAKAILQLANLECPPLRLLMGKIAIASARSKLESINKDLNDYIHISESVTFET